MWMVAFGLNVISNLQYDPPAKAFAFAVLAVLFEAAILFGNGAWLIPHFYRQKRYLRYTIFAVILVSLSILARSFGALYIARVFDGAVKARLPFGLVLYGLLSGVWIFIFSILYRLAMDYAALSRRQHIIAAEKARTELNLLKQQVHPHFLFNTLNNIYYIARKSSPEAAGLIERLSAIMRYFIEESKKDEVLLSEEIKLLKSYIQLECIRMRFDLAVDFTVDGDTDRIMIPPLLFLPLVENIFKHGVDKRRWDNFAEISVKMGQGTLMFMTRNKYLPTESNSARTGSGLANLNQRLCLYYDDRYRLDAGAFDAVFIASLKIPLHAN